MKYYELRGLREELMVGWKNADAGLPNIKGSMDCNLGTQSLV